MPRNTLSMLVCLAVFGLSCEPLRDSDPTLPPVSAAAAFEAESAPAAPPHDERIARVTRHIATRRSTGMTEAETARVARTIVEESVRFGIDPALVLAVIHVESRYHAFAVSPVGAMGLMQILPSTGEELAAREGVLWRGPQTLFDPVTNVRLGVAYLKELSDRYGNIAMALAAYNWGPGHIDRRIRRGTPMPTVYPGLVLEAYSSHAPRRS